MTPRSAVFLEQRSYRRRRMYDAFRLLPFLGFALWMVPLLWPVPETGEGTETVVRMSLALKYVFGIWVLMVLVASGLWVLTRHPDPPDPNRDARRAGPKPAKD